MVVKKPIEANRSYVTRFLKQSTEVAVKQADPSKYKELVFLDFYNVLV